MSHASSKKYIVNMLKSNDNIFRNQFFREVLFDKNGRRILLYRELSSNPFLRGKIGNILCAKSLAQLNDVRFVYNSQMTNRDAIIYAGNLLCACSNKVNRYISLRKNYECAYLNRDFEKAAGILETIESEVCVSLWSCGQKLMIKEQTLGLEGNKSELSNMFDSIEGNFILLTIIYFYSCMAEKGLSYENYQTEFLRFMRDYEGSALGRYFTGKLSFANMYENDDISFLVQIDSQCSIIDLYNTVERYFPAVVYDAVSTENTLLLGVKTETIASNLFMNYDLLTSQNGGMVLAHLEQNKAIFDIIESYTIGDYSSVVAMASTYLSFNPTDVQIAILFCKSIICSGIPFPEQMQDTYIEALYAIYNLSDTYRDAIMKLKQDIKIHQGSILSLKLHAFLKRKHIETGNPDATFVSSLLDPVIHPNFLRYFKSGAKESEIIINRLSPYCPNAISLSKAIQNGNFEDDSIKVVDEKKKLYLFANHLCSEANYDTALGVVEKFAGTYNSNNYLKERLQRIKLKSYVGKKDYIRAIKSIVSIYFDNEFMFERLSENGYCNLPRKIKDKSLDSDIDYIIFRYIMSPSDYSKQISAYCNYIEGNNYSNILEFVEQADETISRECLFFLEKVCSVNLLKRDVTLSTLRISAESARVLILQKLSVLLSTKKYSAEIQSLLTAETIKENLQTINQSRIYADTAKIFAMHKEQWEEIYAKYLALKFVDAYYVDFDLKGQHSEDVETLGFRFTTHERITQAVIVFKNMVDQIIEECLFSVQYGLETFLSSRIRHGYCKGQLTTFLDDLHLMVKKKTEDSDEYILSEYWGNRINSTAVAQNVHGALSLFTGKIESKITEILGTWLRIKYKEGSKGYFDYTYLIDYCVDMYYYSNYTSFTIFFNKLITTFWAYSQSLLNSIRNRIENELTEYYLQTISDLESDLRKIPYSQEAVQELLANCNLAKAKVVQTMTQFSAAFTVNQSSYNDFTMEELIASCKRVTARSHSSSDSISWKITADNSILFSGKYFASFVDILNILLSNAIEHSGHEYASDLSIRVAISEVVDQEEKEKTMLPQVHMFGKIMCMEVTNTLSERIDKELLEQKLTQVFIELNENNPRNAKIQTEGGSGLYKLYNVATFNLDTLCSLLFDINDNEITIWCYFVGDPLISSKVENDENIAN